MLLQLEHLIINGYVGTWYVVESGWYRGDRVYLLEHETFGDMSQHLVIDENLKVIFDEFEHGFAEIPEWNF